ncbi:MAG: HAMP domain-containing histidine kinase [Chromatiales bacterium]|nr:HAMP domain-containing histidine kinase [Chromatiales bacterium]
MLMRISRSLSARLLAVFLVTSVIYVMASRYAVQAVYDYDYLRQIVGAHISLHADYVLSDIGTPPDLARAEEIVQRIPVDMRIQGPGTDWVSDPRFPPLESLEFGPLEFVTVPEGSQQELAGWARNLEQVQVARQGNHGFVLLTDGDFRIVFASPRMGEARPRDLTRWTIAVISLLVLLGCYLGVRWIVQPIGLIKQGAARIGHGELDWRIPATRRDDLGELAVDINRMASDVQEMLEAKRQLLLAISHELRSPLTRAKVSLEFVDEEALRESLLDDIREMERLIADLLESERLNTRHSKLQRSNVDLRALVSSVLDQDFAERRADLVADLPPEELVRSIDATRIRLLLRNLVENALRVMAPGGEPVEVALRKVPGAVQLVVSDRGPGIEPEHLPRVTEPFYRSDPARSRTTGGFGLGLYLCRRIAEAHEGRLEIDSTPGHGTTVVVTLPDQAPASAS